MKSGLIGMLRCLCEAVQQLVAYSIKFAVCRLEKVLRRLCYDVATVVADECMHMYIGCSRRTVRLPAARKIHMSFVMSTGVWQGSVVERMSQCAVSA